MIRHTKILHTKKNPIKKIIIQYTYTIICLTTYDHKHKETSEKK